MSDPSTEDLKNDPQAKPNRDRPQPLHPESSEADFLTLQQEHAKAAIGRVMRDLKGALAEGANYTRDSSRVWAGSLANNVYEDPYTLLHYGEFWAELHASSVLADHAATLLDAAWQQGLALEDAERGEVALAVFSSKVQATRAGLDVTTRIFEVAGARATTAKLRMDRFWRNLRVYTLHDPVDYKFKELGDWALNGQYPTPRFYS